MDAENQYEIPNFGGDLPAPPAPDPPLPGLGTKSSRTDLKSVKDNNHVLKSPGPPQPPPEISYCPLKPVATESTMNKVSQFGAGASQTIESKPSKNSKAKFVKHSVNYKRDFGVLAILIIVAVLVGVTIVGAMALMTHGTFKEFDF